ncbi:MAG: anhydro-N-acetylmuramic acid kinase [Chloroflexi bacterium]|nr:anhydro-N-acetylmuramic acid kinase [Chloroflexota bacterium]MCI0576259.1 anhydro-N-acetylmuramic acid kinase [Chloroflexota bacterium]MCI0644545.1 anhydro-N-acetylmuramic acid kinase [Chloroflexota bacterium]MCI0728766.1 anhydro-N-acetylmuramic acid kinase [Chloroflexota bacterium]
MIVAGLMSGTSADGTDVAIVEIDGAPPALHWRLFHYGTVPHPPGLRAAILAATQAETGSVAALSTLNVALGEQLAQAALAEMARAGLTPAQVQLVGSHGQTVWHAPEGTPPSTLQVGEATVIAERLGVPVVSNFRLRDMAAGGQGAPLVAYVDTLLLTHPSEVRAAQNIGGIANVTFLPPLNRPELALLAFDTGPGNVLLDHAAARITQGRLQYDRHGALADQGRVDGVLLGWLLEQPYFARRPPKSTGRELFTNAFAEAVWQRAEAMGLALLDTIATLTAFTAQTISRAYRDFLPCLPEVVIISGGGARNLALLRMLADAVHPATVLPSDAMGIPGQAKEALAFAILAYESWHGRPGNLPAATGASRPVVLGQITADRL